MTLSISPGSSSAFVTSALATGSVALTSAATSNNDAPVLSVSEASPSDSPSLKDALKSLGLQAKLANDLQDVASALTPALLQVVQDRPDLATAHFDFQSDQGHIKVIDPDLSDDDKAWLERTLNGDAGLVDAVQTFHDDAASSYALWASANNLPGAADNASQASSLADKRFSFLDLFTQASQSIGQSLDPRGQYTAADGSPLTFPQSVHSALSFLVFQHGNQAVLSGTNTYTTSNGQRFPGSLSGNAFASTKALLSFLPTASSNSVGLNVTA